MAISGELQRRIAAMAQQLSVEAPEVDESDGVCWLDAVENQAIEIADALAAEVVKQRSLNRPAPAEALVRPAVREAAIAGRASES